jgi:hypothetical protein
MTWRSSFSTASSPVSRPQRGHNTTLYGTTSAQNGHCFVVGSVGAKAPPGLPEPAVLTPLARGNRDRTAAMLAMHVHARQVSAAVDVHGAAHPLVLVASRARHPDRTRIVPS